MSAYVRALNGLLVGTKLPRGARAVYMALTPHVDPRTGETWCGRKLLGDLAGITEANVTRSTQALEAAGLLAVLHRDGTTNLYRFPMLSALSTTPRATARGPQSTTPRATAPPPARQRADPPRGGARGKNKEGTTKKDARGPGHFSPGSGWLAEG